MQAGMAASRRRSSSPARPGTACSTTPSPSTRRTCTRTRAATATTGSVKSPTPDAAPTPRGERTCTRIGRPSAGVGCSFVGGGVRAGLQSRGSREQQGDPMAGILDRIKGMFGKKPAAAGSDDSSATLKERAGDVKEKAGEVAEKVAEKIPEPVKEAYEKV